MRYFAYGSNMDVQQMTKRCPSSRFVAVARLPGYGLRFPRHSKGRGCGVASIEANPGESVWGVVYEFDDRERSDLDQAEGVQNGAYAPQEIRVFSSVDATEMQAFTYVAQRQKGDHKPSREYKGLIVGGAIHWGLPTEYQQRLAVIETQR